MKADIKFLSGLDHSNSIEILLGNVYKGDKGKSAYEIAVDNGFEGSEGEWLASLKVMTDTELSSTSENAIANKTVTKEINNLNANTGIDEYEEFSDQKEYKAGTTVKKDGLLYTFKVDHAAGAWNESQVENTSLKRDFDKKVTELDNKVSTQLPAIEEAKNEALNNINENEQSAISNFNAQRVTPEMLSESTKQLIDASGGGTITNLADDEDITSVDDGTGSNVLKLADRTYNAENFSGKGYKILRKNIVGGKNVLTQDMINEENTIYEVRYDFDLNGKSINIAKNVTVLFNGGSFNNGEINRVSNDSTFINSSFNNVTFTGGYENFGTLKYYFNEDSVKNNEKNILLGDFIYLSKRSSNNDEGGGFYKAEPKGGYATNGGIELSSLTLVPVKSSSKGIFNVNKYGILPNGEDMSDKLNKLLQSDMQWIFNEGTLYFPAGTYIFKKPINFTRRYVILGDENGFRNGTYSGTEFDFSDIVNNTEDDLYCITCTQLIKKLRIYHLKVILII